MTKARYDRPNWDIAIVDGKPEVVMNAAMIRALMKQSPYGVAEARRRLIAAGVPAEQLDNTDE